MCDATPSHKIWLIHMWLDSSICDINYVCMWHSFTFDTWPHGTAGAAQPNLCVCNSRMCEMSRMCDVWCESPLTADIRESYGLSRENFVEILAVVFILSSNSSVCGMCDTVCVKWVVCVTLSWVYEYVERASAQPNLRMCDSRVCEMSRVCDMSRRYMTMSKEYHTCVSAA